LPREKHELPMQIMMELRGSGAMLGTFLTQAG
jgi:hypothetical protein